MFLPGNAPSGPGAGDEVEEQVEQLLDIPSDGPVIRNLRYLGLFDETVLECGGHTPAEMLMYLLRTRLSIPTGGRDVVILHHVLDVRTRTNSEERVTATMVTEGEAEFTAMSRTVGLPTALATRLLLEGKLTLTGSLIPTHPAVYRPVLAALEAEGLAFREAREPMQPLRDRVRSSVGAERGAR